MDIDEFQKRITYHGDVQKIFALVAHAYKFGSLRSYTVILQGYEDFNSVIVTDKGKYFIKIFSASRSNQDIQKYVEIMEVAVNNGISHPKLLSGPDGNLFTCTIENTINKLVVMEYIDGKDFFQLHQKPTYNEMVFLSQQAAKINQIIIKPSFVYDSWAIPNLLREFETTKNFLEHTDLELIKPLVRQFESLHISLLPHALVHGDIISTNVIRSTKNTIYIIDFAVSNWYPRIQELAVLLSDLFFINDKQKYLQNYDTALREYQKVLPLEKIELDILPTYVKLAHAMHIIPAIREKVKGNNLPENNFWLQSGREGLRLASNIW